LPVVVVAVVSVGFVSGFGSGFGAGAG